VSRQNVGLATALLSAEGRFEDAARALGDEMDDDESVRLLGFFNASALDVMQAVMSIVGNHPIGKQAFFKLCADFPEDIS